MGVGKRWQIPTAPALADLDTQVQELQQAICELAELDEVRLHLLLPKVAKRYGIGKDKLLQWVNEHQQGELVQEPTAHAAMINCNLSPFGSGIYRQRLMNWRSNRPNLGNTPYFIRG